MVFSIVYLFYKAYKMSCQSNLNRWFKNLISLIIRTLYLIFSDFHEIGKNIFKVKKPFNFSSQMHEFKLLN